MIEYALDKTAAINYAKKWAYSRNPAYYNFDLLGGDCTNFISQCVYAAGAVMNDTKDTGWYYYSLNDRAAAWTGVEFFYRFIVRNQGVGPFGREVPISDVGPGDVIQLGNESGFYHSLLTVGVYKESPYVAAHSFDAFMKPLSAYVFQRCRVLRLDGARKTGTIENCSNIPV